MATSRKRVLIICTGNSCRSQMAEGFVNHLASEGWEAHSAGTSPAQRVHPLATRVMAEVGIDISRHTPRQVAQFVNEPWDLVITVCDSAKETCPHFPGRVARRHLSFVDPASANGAEEERLAVFRRVRDEIRDRLLAELKSFQPEDR